MHFRATSGPHPRRSRPLVAMDAVSVPVYPHIAHWPASSLHPEQPTPGDPEHPAAAAPESAPTRNPLFRASTLFARRLLQAPWAALGRCLREAQVPETASE